MEEYVNINHTFEPVYDKNTRILILGTFPSVKSREYGFYYGHPQNRFWRVLSGITDSQLPVSIQEKKEFLLSHHIGIWDVIKSCTIKGSDDSSIKNVVPTDIMPIIRNSKITRVFCNGSTSGKYYKRYQQKDTGIEAVVLPSTSPANAAFSLEKLIKAWNIGLGTSG